MKNKYNIHSDFIKMGHKLGFLNQATPAVYEIINKHLRELWEKNNTDEIVKITKNQIISYDGKLIPIQIIEPLPILNQAPCLIFYHAGGFVVTGMEHHIHLTRQYALLAQCKVIYIDYRLLPGYAFPTPLYDAYSLLEWVTDHAGEIGIDIDRIILCGDGVGGNLAAGVSLLSRDRTGPKVAGQMMIFPVIDARQTTESMKIFTDTPIWNSNLNQLMWDVYLKNKAVEMRAYTSLMEIDTLAKSPPTFIETAEFDCLRDEAVAYAQKLQYASVPVTLHQTQQTIHSYDMIENNPITQSSMNKRIAFLKSIFKN